MSKKMIEIKLKPGSLTRKKKGKVKFRTTKKGKITQLGNLDVF